MKFNVVLYNPEIPENTGNIMRTCVASNFKLHLIEPLGFILDERHLKRACVDYYQYVNYERYINWNEFVEKNPGKYYFMTRYGQKSPADVNYTECDEDIYLIFGRESTGIPYDLLAENLDNCFRLPMTDKVRALNLSNTVAICVYEVLRQYGYPELITHEPDSMKGKNFLENFKK